MTTYRRIAALGSSYAAGPGIQPVVNRAAMRSGNNYAHVLARALGAELTDLTVSGATTSTVLDVPQRVGFVTFAPQIRSLPADADLVLITAAGNDLEYLGSAVKLGVRFTLDRYTHGLLQRWIPAGIPVATRQQRDRAAAGLARIVTETRSRAPQARVVLVDYLPMVGGATVPFTDVPFDRTVIDALAVIHDQLSSVFIDVAGQTGADLAQASRLGRGHELGSPFPWIQPLQPVHRIASSFHPTADGMKAVARELLKIVGAPLGG
ncbi:SGNH/GDSL hydrolase family protein [Mycobacterium sp. DBP42]|uniref:SGNH/GDSL hydrolase family protein n=1 Tax=Mycobacterium sp. DBP42 TaxID=2545267 RepID=UPI00110CA9EE|nr:SGNH/GDSL hydrolase family protein [Mycobacterium sp. DBP42]TMS51618.1 SGNH/GDSL hydrolase family protein [Mycobacterium sp. DBP42]